MREYQIAPDIRLRVDERGNITLLQVDPFINPEIATNVINLSAQGATRLLVALTEEGAHPVIVEVARAENIA